MDVAGTIAYLPLPATALGAAAGYLVGRLLPGRWIWALPAALTVVSIALLVRLAAIQPGNEEAAFGPFVWLTGGVFPALFAVIMGTYLGRALRNRAESR